MMMVLGPSSRSASRVAKSQNVKTWPRSFTKMNSSQRSMQSGIIDWIGKLYKDARGFEIGTFNPVLLSTLMKKQSAKWPGIAQGLVSDIITSVHLFIRNALLAACHDSRISSNILSMLMDNLIDKYRQAISAVDFLLDIERSGTPHDDESLPE